MDITDARQFIAGAKWQYAKTMPRWPHWYTVKDWADRTQFEEMCRFIASNGVVRKMAKWTRPYLDVDEYYYWTMGAAPEDTTIINRALYGTNGDLRS